MQVRILVRKVRNKAAGKVGDAVLFYDRLTGRYKDPVAQGVDNVRPYDMALAEQEDDKGSGSGVGWQQGRAAAAGGGGAAPAAVSVAAAAAAGGRDGGRGGVAPWAPAQPLAAAGGQQAAGDELLDDYEALEEGLAELWEDAQAHPPAAAGSSSGRGEAGEPGGAAMPWGSRPAGRGSAGSVVWADSKLLDDSAAAAGGHPSPADSRQAAADAAFIDRDSPLWDPGNF